MLFITTWFWGTKYSKDYPAKLERALQRHVNQPYKFYVISPLPEDEPLAQMKGCFARLRMFDPNWQRSIGMEPGDRLLNMDLDTVVVRELDPLVERPEDFVIMQGGNSANPCPYNGALMLIKYGAHPEVWNDFSLKAAAEAPFYEFPDDQGWIHYKVPNAAGWKCGPDSGVYVFRKPGWPGWEDKASYGDNYLPPEARLVTFSGWRTPKGFHHLQWIKENWI